MQEEKAAEEQKKKDRAARFGLSVIETKEEVRALRNIHLLYEGWQRLFCKCAWLCSFAE